jgi:RNA polymerase II subunit A small phosphatase-like protein
MTEKKSEILVILDIDETLLYATKEQLDIDHNFKISDYFVYIRPHLHEFIEFVDQNFQYAIWSSASDNYVKEITEKLELTNKAVFCWARSKATYKRPSSFDSDGNLNVDSIDHHFFVKRLKKVKKLGFDLERILIIDDTPHKSQENYGNAIYVTEYKGDQDDNELLKLTEYLTTLKQVDNVRNIEKRNWKEKIKH